MKILVLNAGPSPRKFQLWLDYDDSDRDPRVAGMVVAVASINTFMLPTQSG